MAKELHPLSVLLKPMITEKATRLNGDNQYAFRVQRRANKVQIKEAVEKGFPGNVKVLKVNVMNMKGKPKRVRGNRIKHSPAWKKAVVTLAPENKLELFEGV